MNQNEKMKELTEKVAKRIYELEKGIKCTQAFFDVNLNKDIKDSYLTKAREILSLFQPMFDEILKLMESMHNDVYGSLDWGEKRNPGTRMKFADISWKVMNICKSLLPTVPDEPCKPNFPHYACTVPCKDAPELCECPFKDMLNKQSDLRKQVYKILNALRERAQADEYVDISVVTDRIMEIRGGKDES